MEGNLQETGEKMYEHKTDEIRMNGQNYLLKELYYLHSSWMLLGHKKLPGYMAQMMDTRNMNRISHRILIIKCMQGLSFIGELRKAALMQRWSESASIHRDTCSAQAIDRQNTLCHR
jgi:hypothetical protein